MIRTDRWKLVFRYPAGPHELFDLQADPAERINCYDSHPNIAAGLKAPLDAFYSQHDALCSGLRVKEQPVHNGANEAWRDGRREARGLQVY